MFTANILGQNKGVGLSIGVNKLDPAHYSGWAGTLEACEQDAKDMAALITKAGYSTKLLLNDGAKRDPVVAIIRKAANELVAGDMFVLYFSGHGSQTADGNGDEDDRLDETWCLHDGQLVDDELYHLWRAFKKGVRILVFSDSCHSGTMIKVDDFKALTRDRRSSLEDAFSFLSGAKALPPSKAVETFMRHTNFYDTIQRETPKEGSPGIQATVQLISACKDSEEASDGNPNSAFTASVKRVWRDGEFSGDYREFTEQVRSVAKRTNPRQTAERLVLDVPNSPYESQKPFTIKAPK